MNRIVYCMLWMEESQDDAGGRRDEDQRQLKVEDLRELRELSLCVVEPPLWALKVVPQYLPVLNQTGERKEKGVLGWIR